MHSFNNVAARHLRSVLFSLALPVLAMVLFPAQLKAVTITDNVTMFTGDFSAERDAALTIEATVFDSFPINAGDLNLRILVIQRGATIDSHLYSTIYTQNIGAPNDPNYGTQYTPPPFSGVSLSGYYTNGNGGGTVDWAFTDLADTGGPNGTFSGSFSFMLRGSNNVPDGGSTALMLGLALVGFGAAKRKLR